MFQNGIILRPGHNETEIPDKYITPTYMLEGTHLPDYVGGCGWIISRAAVHCMYTTALDVPLYHINDIVITGFVRDMCGMVIHNVPEWTYQPHEVIWSEKDHNLIGGAAVMT